MNGTARKVVVIRNIASNLVEEAILILREEPAGKNSDKKNTDVGMKAKTASRLNDNRQNDFLIKEAQLIIDNYIKENGLCIDRERKRGVKKGIIGRRPGMLMLINFALAAGILLLIFMMIKLF